MSRSARDQVGRDAAQAEPADRDGHAVGDGAGDRLGGAVQIFVAHADSLVHDVVTARYEAPDGCCQRSVGMWRFGGRGRPQYGHGDGAQVVGRVAAGPPRRERLDARRARDQRRGRRDRAGAPDRPPHPDLARAPTGSSTATATAALVPRARAVPDGRDRGRALRHHRARARQRAGAGGGDGRERVPVGATRATRACACCARRGRSRSGRSCCTRGSGFRSGSRRRGSRCWRSCPRSRSSATCDSRRPASALGRRRTRPTPCGRGSPRPARAGTRSTPA